MGNKGIVKILRCALGGKCTSNCDMPKCKECAEIGIDNALQRAIDALETQDGNSRLFRRLSYYIKIAKRDKHIEKPIAYALYRTWKEYDEEGL